MIFSLKRIYSAVERQNTHLINPVSVLLCISLAECYKFVINKDRNFQTGGEFSSELAV